MLRLWRPVAGLCYRRGMKTIRQLRQERDWSQPDLARRLGVVPRTVSAWECGVRVPGEVYRQRLADLFGVSVGKIAFGPAEPAPQDRP